MTIPFTTRNFYPDELRLLKRLKSNKEKQTGSKIKVRHFVVAALLGAACSYIAAQLPDSFWTFLFGTVAVFSFAFIVFMPYEMYKLQQNNKLFLQQLNDVINAGIVDTCVIHANRIALAREYEDEGDLYIIEFDTDKVLYMWDSNCNLQKKFPCLDFEIYEDSFSKLVERQVYAVNDRIAPVEIDRKVKWHYMGKVGAPGHMEIQRKNLDQVIQEFYSAAQYSGRPTSD